MTARVEAKEMQGGSDSAWGGIAPHLLLLLFRHCRDHPQAGSLNLNVSPSTTHDNEESGHFAEHLGEGGCCHALA
jgi:hypothetical protein